MSEGIDPDVLIAGAGPVGLTAALALSAQKIPIQIIDSGIWPCQHSYALALHPQSLKLYEQYGLLDSVMENAYPVFSAALYDRQRKRAQLNFDLEDEPSACIAVTRQDMLEERLERELLSRGIQVKWRHELAQLETGSAQPTAVVHKLERESRGYVIAGGEWVTAYAYRLEPEFVIGADGYNSRVRRAAGGEFRECGPARYYGVFEFKTDYDLNNEMALVLGDGTTDVLWPLPDQQCRWSFELPEYHDAPVETQNDRLTKAGFPSIPTERVKDRNYYSDTPVPDTLDDGKLASLLAERAPWFKGSVENIRWRTVVRFERRLTSSFGKGRMWLAGDSAHLTGPAGIQSMNAGIAEAVDLSDTIAGILRSGGSAAELDAYARRWTHNWRQMLGLEGSAVPGSNCDSWVAAHASQLIGALPAAGPEMATLIEQIDLHLAAPAVA